MKRADVIQRLAAGVIFEAQVITNPANTREWILLLSKEAGRSYFLVDDAEQVESFASLDGLIAELRQLGIKRVEVQL